jgi:hypothetical protein
MDTQKKSIPQRNNFTQLVLRGLFNIIMLFSSASVFAASPYMPNETACFPSGESPYHETGNYLFTKSGMGSAVADINKNGKEDLVLVTYSLSIGSISGDFTYTIGWDIDASTGIAASWTSPLKIISGFSHLEIYDVGVAIRDINRNGSPDMLVMAFANVASGKKFVYRIAWDLNTSGNATSVSNKYEVDGVGNAEVWDGAGVALHDINGDGAADMVLMAYVGNENILNNFRCHIGWDVDTNGIPASWTTNYINIPGLGKRANGADLLFEDIDLDGAMDLVLMAYDTTDGRNIFRYKVGWHVNTTGRSDLWSRWFQLKGVGSDIAGAGLAYYYDRISGPRLIMAAHYHPEGSRKKFRYLFLPVTTSGAHFGRADDYPPRINNQLSVPTSSATLTPARLFNLNMSEVRTVANDAVALLLFGCWLAEALGEPTPVVCRYNYPEVEPSFGTIISESRFDYEMAPDSLVASVANYVDYYMGYARDNINSYVLNDYHNLNYYSGAANVPAYYTIYYTDPARHEGLIDNLQDQNAEWALVYNDGRRFHGDCEDHAILRHALLRALGFDRNFIWNVGAPGHAFNVVVYRGVYRIMDYGPIHRYLDSPSGITTDMRSAWNTNNGPNQSWSEKENNLYKKILRKIYPDRCNGGVGWAFTRYANPDIP